MTGDQPAQPSSPVPGPAGSTAEWEVHASDDQDRWTLSLPANTLQARCIREYQDKHQKDPSLQDLPMLPKYVKVTAARRAKRKKRSVLKTELIQGGGETFATIATRAFGPDVASISLVPSTQWRFRVARLSTRASRLNLAAVILGAASAVITAMFTIVIGAPQPGQGPSGAVLAWGVIAAVSAFAAPLLALASNIWFSD